MYVIVIIKNFTSQNLSAETSPEVFLVPEGVDPVSALRQKWEDCYQMACALAFEYCAFGDDEDYLVDEERCLLEDDIGVVAWENGDTQKFHLLEVKDWVKKGASEAGCGLS